MYGDRDIKHKKRSGFYFIATKNVVLKGTEPRFIIQKAKFFSGFIKPRLMQTART